MERTERVNGQDTPVRTIKVKDSSGSCTVSLWRDLTKEKTIVGSHITLTNVIVQVYNDEKSMSTTSRTNIEVKSFFNFSGITVFILNLSVINGMLTAINN